MTHVHLIGIGGSGLSAIARVLLESGYTVSGSDNVNSPLAQNLSSSGIRVYNGHNAQNIIGADIVVRSSAIPDSNPEVQAALKNGIPVKKRSDFLGQIMLDHSSIAVAGTHGKTTTTAMIAWTLTMLGQDPSYIIGGVSKNLNQNAHAGKGKFFVIEADEYDGMFLGLNPQYIVINNIEHDHPDCFPTPEAYRQAFIQFMQRLKPGGTLLICQDHPGSANLINEAPEDSRVFTFGVQTQSNYQAKDINLNHTGSYDFSVCYTPEEKSNQLVPLTDVSLQVPGTHNILNSLVTIAAIHQLGLSLDQAALALTQYQGTERRFEIIGEVNGIIFIDDYAHHPSEITSTLTAARDRFPNQRIIAIWQPHTFSRTQTLLQDFLRSFDLADEIIVTEIYAARETNPNYSSSLFIDKFPHSNAVFASTLAAAEELLLTKVCPGDVVLILSAGDANQIGFHLLDKLGQEEKKK